MNQPKTSMFGQTTDPTNQLARRLSPLGESGRLAKRPAGPPAPALGGPESELEVDGAVGGIVNRRSQWSGADGAFAACASEANGSSTRRHCLILNRYTILRAEFRHRDEAPMEAR